MKSNYTAIFEKGDKYYIGYCPEVPGANGQDETLADCRESLKEAIKLILEDRVEDAMKSIPDNAIREILVIE
jgi:predicted RNase H-like HicB family nuclease